MMPSTPSMGLTQVCPNYCIGHIMSITHTYIWTWRCAVLLTYIHTYICLHMHLQVCAVQLIKLDWTSVLQLQDTAYIFSFYMHTHMHTCAWRIKCIEILVNSTHIQSRYAYIFCCVHYNLYKYKCTQFAQTHASSFTLVHTGDLICENLT